MATAPRPPDVSDALARVETLLAGSPAPQVPDRLDPACIRWVCLVPVWTPTLAARCGMPGWGSASDLDVLEAWRDEGLIEAMLTPLSIDDTGQVTPRAAPVLGAAQRARPAWFSRIVAEDGRDRLAALVHDIAAPHPRATARSAHAHRHVALGGRRLARHQPTSTLRETLRARTGPGARAGAPRRGVDVDRGVAAPSPRWCRARRRRCTSAPCGAWRCSTASATTARCCATTCRDRRSSTRISDLLTGPDDRWAMHYLGGGGVGKTMLMRALTSGTAEHLPAGFEVPPTVTARIDFDHINPDYPARRPGLLFAQLAEELRLKDDSLRASENFGLLFNRIALLHERAGGDVTPAADIDDMLDVFRWACEAVADPAQGTRGTAARHVRGTRPARSRRRAPGQRRAHVRSARSACTRRCRRCASCCAAVVRLPAPTRPGKW